MFSKVITVIYTSIIIKYDCMQFLLLVRGGLKISQPVSMVDVSFN